MNRKVTVVGAPATSARPLPAPSPSRNWRDVVIVDIANGKGAGHCPRHFPGVPIDGSDTALVGTSDYADDAGSDVVVITSGVPRKPGMSRDDLLQVNYKIMQAVTEQVIKHSPNAVIVPVPTRSTRCARPSTG
jgi:malate dehydrogenase